MEPREKLMVELSNLHQELVNSGRLPSQEKLEQYYALFRDRFGPERLANIDGEALLNLMHQRDESRDSLVYWLEFKNDNEFPSIFGSISGGSALKFGIYQRQEDGAWITGSSHKQIEITEADAMAFARKQRDQLLRGVELLKDIPANAPDKGYRWLQEKMQEVAPDICDTAWGHKYFSLIFPDKLDDYHVEHYQRFHLVKLLQVPPEGNGRFLCAGRYVAIASNLSMPLNHLASVLNIRHDRPHRYWRIGTKLARTDSRWLLMKNNNCVAIGWPDIGDLSHVAPSREGQEEIRSLLKTHYYPDSATTAGRKMREIYNFVATVNEDDYVLAADGSQILGIGRVVGEYVYDKSSDVPHRRPVEWLSIEEWPLPLPEGLQTTVYELKQKPENLVEAERKVMLQEKPIIITPPIPERIPPKLTGIPGRIQSILSRKKQVILFGPPGTGKTYWARLAAQDLAALSRYGRLYADLTPDQQKDIYGHNVETHSLVRVCTFHPAYGYEDFLEGYRPVTVDQQLTFVRRNGIFKQLCEDAQLYPDLNYYLIIDEINRGDIPRIFGELLTILEQDKRGQAVLLPLSGDRFFVPENVYLIGTMNTADRSIALLDAALRRRFGFIELMPDSKILRDTVIANSVPLGPWLDALNDRILEHIGRDARNLQVGHAYLLVNGRPVANFSQFIRILQDDIIPLLEEYCYEDYGALARILGDSLVDERHQRIRHELFEVGQQDALIEALLSPSPDLMASALVVATLGTDDNDRDEELGEEENVDEETTAS